jgi:hypothetical protein
MQKPSAMSSLIPSLLRYPQDKGIRSLMSRKILSRRRILSVTGLRMSRFLTLLELASSKSNLIFSILPSPTFGKSIRVYCGEGKNLIKLG